MLKRRASVACLLLLYATTGRAQSLPSELGAAGWKAVQRDDGDAAASAFRQALQLHPSDPALIFGAGVAAHMQGREREALTWLEKAVAIEPRLTQAAALLGEIAYHEGELDLAIRTYESAVARAPEGGGPFRERLDAWRNEAAVHRGLATVKDDRFSVMFDGPVEQKLAMRATTVLGNAFWTIGKAIGAFPNAPITVIFYSDQQFRDITGAPEWAGGGFDGQIRLPVRGALNSPQAFDRVLVHELTHAMLRQVAARNVPVWLNEGLAMLFEGNDPAAVERSMVRARLFIPLSNLRGSFSELNATEAALAYSESLFATSALLERIRPDGLAQLLQDMDGGEPIDQAIQRFGLTFADFEASLIRRIGRR